MKSVIRAYIIKRNGYYIMEHNEVGMFYTVSDIDEATLFGSIESVTSYVEHDLKLNLANVSIIEIRTVVTETPLVLYEGSFVDINTVCYCEGCAKWLNPKELTAYQHDIGSDKELLCAVCYEKMTDKYPNILVGGNSYE